MGARVLVIEHEADAGLGWFAEWLPQAGVEPEVVRPYAGDPVPHEVRQDGLIVLGGSMAAWEDVRAPWLPATRALLARAAADDLPTLGICLGAQLLTLACGGTVERAVGGPEVGAVTVEVDAPGDPVLGRLPAAACFVAWHFDAMTRLPPGAVLLACSAACPHQAYRLGRRVSAVQFHPEVTLDDVTTWAQADAAHLSGLGIDHTAVLDGIAARQTEILAVSRTLAHAFAAVVTG